MTALALGFMVTSWAFVLGLTASSFRRVLRNGADRTRKTELPASAARLSGRRKPSAMDPP